MLYINENIKVTLLTSRLVLRDLKQFLDCHYPYPFLHLLLRLQKRNLLHSYRP